METTGNDILYEWIEGTGCVVYIDEDTFPWNEFTIPVVDGYTDENNYCYDMDGNLLTLTWFYDIDSETYLYAAGYGTHQYKCDTNPYESIFDNGCAKIIINLHIENEEDLPEDACVRFMLYDQKDTHITYQFDVNVHEDESKIYLPVSYYSVTTEQIGFETTGSVCAPYVIANRSFLFEGDYTAYNSSTFFSMFLESDEDEDEEVEESESTGDIAESSLDGADETVGADIEETTETTVAPETDATTEVVSDELATLMGVETEDIAETTKSGLDNPTLGIICIVITIVVWRRQRKKLYGH